MSLFNLFKSKKSNIEIAKELLEYVLTYVESEGKRVRVEDAIVILGTIIGERSIDVANQFSLEDHDYVPGSNIFSDSINEIIYGNITSEAIESYPNTSIIGQLRDYLTDSPYELTEFPSIRDIVTSYANDVNVSEKWGTCTWLVPQINFPLVLPIREGYETREKVDEIFKNVPNKILRIEISVLSLRELLAMVKDVLDHKIALTLAIQSINAVSKMASMTDKAMNQYLLTGKYS